MCHFLTIAVPGKSVPEVPKEFRRRIYLAEHTNRSVTQHAPSDWISFTATSGGCSCDFYRTLGDAPDDRSKLEKRYRKHGWSDAKIQRALESQKDASARSAGLRDDVFDLVTLLTNTFGEVRLSLHWYSGDIETEVFFLNDAGRISLEDFKRDATVLRDETTIRIQGEQGGVGHPASRPESK